jgi:hypothetical protein
LFSTLTCVNNAVKATFSVFRKRLFLHALRAVCSGRTLGLDERFHTSGYAQPELPVTMWHLTLVYPDTLETYFDSHVDLLQRKLQKHSDRLKMKAEETFKIKDMTINDLSGDMLAEHFEREFKSFRLKVRGWGICIHELMADFYGA